MKILKYLSKILYGRDFRKSYLENLKKEVEKTQVVILAGGSAKRMGKIDKPKALLELKEGWTLLDNELYFFAKCGFKNFVVVVGYMHEQIEEHIEKMDYKNRFNIEVSVDPTTENLGKGKALKYALQQNKIKKERFIVSFPDDLKLDNSLPLKFILQNLTFVPKCNSLGTITLVNGIEFPFEVAKLNGEGKVISFIEKPLVDTLTSIGLYAFEKYVLDIINDKIDLSGGIVIRKMRLVDHDKEIHPFEIKSGKGIIVYPTEKLFK